MASTAVATRPAAPPPAPAGAPALPAVEPQVHRWGPITMGAAVVAAAEVVLFAALLAAWFASRSAAGGKWVPDKVTLDLYRGTTLAGTALLAALTAQWAASAARRDDGANTIVASAISLGLALAMADLAWFTMIKIGVGAGSSAYATMWFAVLGTYVAIAVATAVAQVVVLAWAISGHYSATDHQPMTAVALQWWVLLGVWVVTWYAIWVLR